MLRHKNRLVQACLFKRKIPQLGEDFSVPCLVPSCRPPPPTHSPSSTARLHCHPAPFFRRSCSPSAVTRGPLFLDGQGSVPGDADRRAGGRLRAAALCPVRLTRRHGDSLQDDTGRGSAWGRKGWRQAREKKEKGFTTLKRVGIPPEPFPRLAGSGENNWLAHTLAACRWILSYESALRTASGGESGELVRNIKHASERRPILDSGPAVESSFSAFVLYAGYCA